MRRAVLPSLTPLTFLAPLAALVLLGAPSGAAAQERPELPPWTQQPPARVPARPEKQPQVALRFDRFYHTDELNDALRELAAAHPDLIEVRKIGTSVEGRDILIAVLTDTRAGADTDKPAFWCDGNIHGNEVQGGEASLYLLWWVTENRDLPRVAELLRERTFYVAPSINPDGRAHWFDAPNTMNSSRGGKRPVDNDRDGLFDEDGPDDIDGDGEVLQMRIRDPNGGWREDPEEPRLLVRVKPGETGTWRLLGTEGIDNDGDGRINEDGPGGYDPNRDWPADWAGPAVQHGAGPYPVSLPETRAVVDFVVAHPNIAGFQSFHNTGGMILRGPGSKDAGKYAYADDRVMAALARRGESQLPFYRSIVIAKDLYTVHGGEVNFAYETLGIFAFSNELWSRKQYLQGAEGTTGDARRDRLQFDDDLELGRRYVDWKPLEHPQLGPIEVGGWTRRSGRVPPSFMIREMCHRNMAFVLYHASEMPLVRAGEATSGDAGGGLRVVEATFENEGMIPTRTQRAVDKKIGAPDRAEITGDGIEVLSGGIVDGTSRRVLEPDVRRPADLRLPRGIGGDGTLRLRWLVRGSGRVTITYRAEKGGTATLTLDL